YIAPGSLWQPTVGQATVVSLNSLGRADRVIAQPGIDSVAALRGKTVGVAEGTSSDMILSLALEHADMTTDDIERVAMDPSTIISRSEEHTSELQSRFDLVCRLLLEKNK